ncbi:arsenate reductase (glutaredoxin) [Thalassotalea profundi]|uniref:Arsenate reductase n=1 Tax=Thalassotalea profundi TaxID=2036687 RepID=A0ABQ3IZT6_9GAMM|nr:arsenate reductase (glutaredoxin) [Thalassotalea profundi]GHE97941.1 arsenate reductase [Thalassotalea profundi]
MFTIYHNPRCSKSRQTLALLEENNVDIKVIEYLKNPLTEGEIKTLLTKLNKSPIDIMRTKETEFSEQHLKDADDGTLIQAMVDTPKLMERPIVVKGNAAIIGRPPENVLTLIS